MKHVLAAMLVAALAGIPLLPQAGAAPAANHQKTSATTTLNIEGMSCASCEASVKEVLQDTPGVTTSSVSYARKRAVVSYDPATTTPAEIAKALEAALPYTVNVAGTAPRAARTNVRPAETSCAAPSAKGSTSPLPLPPYALDGLRMAFNAASGQVRVVALLSPTCGQCQKGQRVVQSVFTSYPDDTRLRGFVVWLPMLAGDTESAAGLQAGAFVDKRVVQQWDGDRAAGKLLAKTLNLKGNAWDVYLLYAPGVKWTGETPPSPTFWMHQLRAESGADQRVCLNPQVFVGRVSQLLAVKGGGA
jgi:copper chaperone CopZ